MAPGHKNIAFIRPILEMGGGDSLMLDLAKALQSGGHTATFFTTLIDSDNCFSEVLNNTTKLEVLPASSITHALFRRFFLLMKVIRLIFVTLQILLTKPNFDLFVINVNHNILLLLWLLRKKHFVPPLTREAVLQL